MNMQKNPRISVIVPTFNTSKYVAACLDSVLAQTFEDFEIICVNDGSTDNSLNILEQYARRDSRIKIINQENQGIVHAKNNGITAASGKYIYPLDSDDMIAPHCLQELHRVIETTDYSVVCCDGITFGRRSGFWRLPRANVLNMYAGRNAIHNSSLYPKELWKKYGGYCKDLNSLCLEDYDFWLCFLDDNKKFTRLRQPMFFYRLKPRSESRNHGTVARSDSAKKIIRMRHPRIRFYTAFRKLFKPFLVFFR
jgi:glycosyltransferase involved in cell wall biosynthesis